MIRPERDFIELAPPNLIEFEKWFWPNQRETDATRGPRGAAAAGRARLGTAGAGLEKVESPRLSSLSRIPALN